jgi:murein L,D-transpeptidase YafK
MSEVAPPARARLALHFECAGASYPPAQFTLAAFKTERRLDLLAADSVGVPRFVRSYPILGASGGVGPKLREGDEQVPEGVYGIESLNPDSRFQVSLRLEYPNAWDRALAAEERRRHLGGDIMILGGFASIGCLAMGEAAAEELFVPAAAAP